MGALQDVSLCPRSLHHEPFSSFCSLILIPSSRRHADTSVLSLAPLKRLALSARVVPSEPHPQPPYGEPLSVQVEEGLIVATVVEESATPPSPVVAAATVEEERTVMETTTPQETLGLPAGASTSGEDVVVTWTTVRCHPRQRGSMTPQRQRSLSLRRPRAQRRSRARRICRHVSM
jgi:hypothetical protein